MIDFTKWKKHRYCTERQKTIQMNELKRLEKAYNIFKKSNPDRASFYLNEMQRLITDYELPAISIFEKQV
jgi:hypothetical protein